MVGILAGTVEDALIVLVFFTNDLFPFCYIYAFCVLDFIDCTTYSYSYAAIIGQLPSSQSTLSVSMINIMSTKFISLKTDQLNDLLML